MAESPTQSSTLRAVSSHIRGHGALGDGTFGSAPLVRVLVLSLTLHIYLVEIAFQVCTANHPGSPEHRSPAGWFPCAPRGNRSRDEGSEQLEGSLESGDEAWLKVSGPHASL